MCISHQQATWPGVVTPPPYNPGYGTFPTTGVSGYTSPSIFPTPQYGQPQYPMYGQPQCPTHQHYPPIGYPQPGANCYPPNPPIYSPNLPIQCQIPGIGVGAGPYPVPPNVIPIYV